MTIEIKQNLLEEIDLMKKHLVETSETYGLVANETVKVSQELDLLLVRYQKQMMERVS